MRRGVTVTALACGVAATYQALLRTPILTWGATDDEASGRLPGDELLEPADGVATRAIEIAAPPSAVWPWIVQMGPSPRGGAYSYDWIENLLGLDMHSTDRVLPEFQHPRAGETIGYGSNRMRLERVEPERVLAWRSGDGNWVWTFVLKPVGTHTRLISRNRFRLPRLIDRIGMVPMEPGSLLMERKMLRGIRSRSEALAAANPLPQRKAPVRGPAAPGNHSHLLVAYATRFGSTRGVAEYIASRLTEAGCDITLDSCDRVSDVGGYDAVICGSAVLNQRWLPEADEFVRRNAQSLATRPAWLFTVGTFGDDKLVIGRLMRREPRNITEITDTIAPVEYRVFAGVIARARWPLASRVLYHVLGGRLGDNRDWDEIGSWADSIADTLARLQPMPAAASTQAR